MRARTNVQSAPSLMTLQTAYDIQTTYTVINCDATTPWVRTAKKPQSDTPSEARDVNEPRDLHRDNPSSQSRDPSQSHAQATESRGGASRDKSGQHQHKLPQTSSDGVPLVISAPVKGSEVGKKRPKGELVCCDLLEFEPVSGATYVQGDFREQHVRDMVIFFRMCMYVFMCPPPGCSMVSVAMCAVYRCMYVFLY
jgi:hypothetical protein